MKNNIKFLRRSAGYDMTQEELARALGVSRTTISAMENGKETTGEMVLKIAHFFDKDPREIFYNHDVACNIQNDKGKSPCIKEAIIS